MLGQGGIFCHFSSFNGPALKKSMTMILCFLFQYEKINASAVLLFSVLITTRLTAACSFCHSNNFYIIE